MVSSKEEKHHMPSTTTLILAGGKSRRMGSRDKSFIKWQGQPLILQTLEFARAQTEVIFISSNRPADIYDALGADAILPDPEGLDHAGPLAGILAGLEYGATDWLFTLPVDTPDLPADLLPALMRSVEVNNAAIAVASFCGNCQQVIGLWHRSIAPLLRDYLENGERRVMPFIRNNCADIVEFDHRAKNMNRPEDFE